MEPRAAPGERPHFHLHVAGSDAILEPQAEEPRVPEDECPDERSALEAFARAARRSPDEPDYHYILGQALVEAGRYREAIDSLEEAVRLHPAEPTYQMSLGTALWRAGRFEPALAAFAEAARLRPDDAAAWSALGAAALVLGRPVDALPALATALTLEPELASALSNRGVAFWDQGQAEAALESFRAAAHAAPEAAYTHNNLGLALLAHGRPKEALGALQKALRLQPASAALLTDLGDTFCRLKRRPEAEAAYRQALEISPTCLERRPASREALLGLTRDSLRDELHLGSLRPALVTRLLAAGMGLVEWAGSLLPSRRRVASGVAILGGAALAYVSFVLAPPFVRHALFKDDLASVASAPTSDEDYLRERLGYAIRKRHLEAFVQETGCQIATSGQVRTVTCRYSVPVGLLPGVQRSLHFEAVVERPFVDFKALLEKAGGAEPPPESE